MNYRILHQTRYLYTESVTLCHNEARLIPRNLPFQTCTSNQIIIDPPAFAYRERVDFFGNRVAYFAIQHPHNEMTITSVSKVTVLPKDISSETAILSRLSSQTDPGGQNLSEDMDWEAARELIQTTLLPDILESRQFVLSSPLIPISEEITAYARESFPPGRAVTAAAYDLMQRIHHDFKFVSGFTNIATPLAEVMKHRQGVCQDFAHVAIACLRAMGLPARYVSGYIETLPPPGKERLVGADASHAWVSVYVPQQGWKDFDPTNNLIPNEQHIIVGWGRDYSDITPLKGIIFTSGKHELFVSVDVERITDGTP